MSVVICGSKIFRTERVVAVNLHYGDEYRTDNVLVATQGTDLIFKGPEAGLVREFLRDGRALLPDLRTRSAVINLAPGEPSASRPNVAEAVCDAIEHEIHGRDC